MSAQPPLTASQQFGSASFVQQEPLDQNNQYDGHLFQQLQRSAFQAGQASVQPQQAPKAGCTSSMAAHWIGVAFAVTAAVIGTVGLLTYLGQMNIGLTAVGNMSSSIGLYTMIGGYGAAFLTGILLGVSKCVGGKKPEQPNA